MAKKKGNIFGQTVVYEKKFNKTSIGRRPKTSSMNKTNADHLKNIEDRENNMEIDQRIGTNENLKLRLEKDKIKEELDQVKIQRDIALRKLNKALNIAKDLRKLIENGK